MLLDRQIDAITFTRRQHGQRTSRRFSARKQGRRTCCGRSWVASIGPVTAEAGAAARHRDHEFMPEALTPSPDLVDALVEHFRK